MKRFGKVVVGAVVIIAGLANNALAAFTMPTMPAGDLELAGTAVAALVAVAVCIKLAIRVLKGA